MNDCTRELFARHQLRCTRQRQTLYETLRACTCHPTAEELYRMLPCTGGMSRATVYNTLETLCSAGLVRRLPTPVGCCRFDADISDHLHVRLGDSIIADVPTELGQQLVSSIPPEVLQSIEQAMGVKIDSVSIQLVAQPDR